MELDIDVLGLQRQLDINGFCLIQGVFSSAEIAQYRDDLVTYFESMGVSYDGGLVQPDLFNYVPTTLTLFENKNFQRVYRELMGTGFCYCNHSDGHVNKITGWHKDRPEAKFISERYNGQIYKVGIYLQDHTVGAHRGRALYVRKGSHLIDNLDEGDLIELNPHIGDLLLFDLRVSHRGVLPSFLERVLNKLLFRKVFTMLRRVFSKFEDKYAIFLTFGVRGPYLEHHYREVTARQTRQNGRALDGLSTGLKNVLNRCGIDVFDMSNEKH